jgi:4,5-DOPA dioxygenase extradiol
MNAIQTNAYTEAWAQIGRSIARPKAILAISAHWYLPKTMVTAMPVPKTIHDFGGFPPELYAAKYPAPGDPCLAQRVQGLLEPLDVGADHAWGLDHGTWSVLCHVYPEADIPVVQLSIDERRAPDFHYELGRKLGPLRDEGVLIVGSGNVVHNLRAYAWGNEPAPAFDWAERFDRLVRERVASNDDRQLVDYERLGSDALHSIPTPEHYLPLLYVLGARRPDDRVTFPAQGIEGGSISMLSVTLGA